MSRAPRRIAIVSPELSLSAGVPHYWTGIARALSEQHEVHVFAAIIDGLPRPGIQVHQIPAIRLGWLALHVSFYCMARARFALARLRGEQPFDVVLGTGALTPFADVVTVHFVQRRELELERAHAYPAERPRGGLAALDYALYSRAMDWLGRRFHRGARQRFVAVSEGVKADLTFYEGVRAELISVVPNGVDVQRFHPSNRARYRSAIREALGVGGEDFLVLFVGNSWGRKGLQVAIDAIVGLREHPVRLVIVGQGSPRSFVAGMEHEQRARIRFVGPRHRDIERYYAAADVLLLPTLYEPFGLTILEAAASGVPCIVSAGAGAAELLSDGKSALLLTDPSDASEVTAALRTLIDDRALAGRLSSDGRRVAERHTWARVADLLLDASGL